MLETHGTLFHGKRVAPALRAWAVGALAAGLGVRAVAGVFGGAPHTVQAWLVEAATPLKACAQCVLHTLGVTPL